MKPIRTFKSSVIVSSGRYVVRGSASGRMHMPSGEIIVTHTYSEPIREFNPGFIPVGALTGIPEPERPVGVVVNPFRGSSSFEFRRRVSFLGHSSEFTIEGGYEDGVSADREGYLHFSGRTPSDKVVSSIHPAVETWIRGARHGQIHGSFDMVFVMEDGEEIIARAETDYSIADSPTWDAFVKPHFRYITIQSEYSKTHLIQKEQLSLFAELPQHVSCIANISDEGKSSINQMVPL